MKSTYCWRLSAVVMLLGHFGLAWAQSAPDSFVIVSDSPTQSALNSVPGLGATGDYPSNRSYNLRFGEISAGQPGSNARIETFTFNNDTYTRVAPPSGLPFDRVIVNRVNNPQVDFEKVTAFFCTPNLPSSPAPNNSTLYYGCDFVNTMEGLINSYILNRGSDNLFANQSGDTTVNNIERVDMILDSGLGSVDTDRTGFLLMERGGNDNFKMAAITSLDSDGEVATLGPLITGEFDSAWGNTGLNILSTVFQSVPSGQLRPSQNITTQAIHGTYVSFADLGIPAGDPIFGVALFPGDVTSTMNLIDLTDVSLNTNGASNTDGGLDFMAGGGFFTAEGVPLPLADIVDVTAECGLGGNNSPVTLNATILNSGVVSFDYWQEGVSSDWTPVPTINGTLNPQSSSPPDPTSFEADWDTTSLDLGAGGVFQIRVTAQANFDLGTVETVLQYNVDTCGTLGTPVTLSSFDSRWQRNGLAVNWSTSSELGNLGFNLYAEDGAGEWTQLNNELIESAVIDSNEPQFYQWQGRIGPAARLFLEDIDILGKETLHGPYEIAGSYGRAPDVQAIDWGGIRSASRSLSGQFSGAVAGLPEVPARLLVEEEGVYRVSYEEMAQAGLIRYPVPVDHLVLQAGGQAVGFRLVGRGREFGPGTELEFYGQASDNPYSRASVYELSVAYSLGSRTASLRSTASKNERGLSVTPVETGTATYRQARERVYSATSVADTPWSDTRMLVQTSPKSWHFDFPVDHLVDDAARLRIRLAGVTDFADFDPDHHVEVWLNGSLLDDIWFEGRVVQELDYALPAGMLVDGSNRLTLRLPGDSGAPAGVITLVDFDLDYSRYLTMTGAELSVEARGRALRVDGLMRRDAVVYRVANGRADPVDGVSISGRGPYVLTIPGTPETARYVVAQGDAIHRPQLQAGRQRVDITSGRADYLMIAHPDFIGGLAPLVAFHEGQGRRVRVVNVLDIYAQFSHGQVDAAAIADYIRATARQARYQHVLLVGGDSYDYRNSAGSGSISFIPSLYVDTSDLVQYAPSDALLVDLNGDEVPDLPIGRLPVRTPEELDAVITKTLQYANRSYTRTAVVSADRQEPGVSFTSQSDRFFEPVLDQWWIERAYLDELGVEQARADLMAGIDAGASATTFVGHSAYTVWTFDGLFNASDVSLLDNAGRPTAVVQWGCWNTYHVVPSYNTMGHQWILTPNRGAALAMGSATFTEVHHSRQFGELLIPELLGSNATAGQAVTRAKQMLARSNPNARDMILGWTILGDPALTMGNR